MTSKYEITDLIDKIVEESTFSVKGVDAIKALRDKAAAQEREIVSLNATIKEGSAANDSLRTENGRLKEHNARLVAREDDLKKREDAMTKIEKEAAVNAAKAEAYRDSMQIVFKPHTVREMVSKSVPVNHPQYGTQYHSESGTTTREED